MYRYITYGVLSVFSAADLSSCWRSICILAISDWNKGGLRYTTRQIDRWGFMLLLLLGFFVLFFGSDHFVRIARHRCTSLGATG